MTRQEIRSYIRKTFRKRIQLLLAESGQTQVEISRATGINKKLLNKYMSGEILPGPDNLVALGEYFEVSIDWMLGASEDRV